MDAKSILKDISGGKYSPIYFLHGEEGFYIDQISNQLENTVVEEAQKGFNFQIFYGKDSKLMDILGAAKRYPMMSEFQLIIVREAQYLKEWALAESYFANPVPSTVLVFCHKHKKIDGRVKVFKTVAKTGLVFESKKIYDNQLPSFIQDRVNHLGLKMHPTAVALLADYLGTDLSKVVNELDKLSIGLEKGSEITLKDVEEKIGLSKDFNVFELNKALGVRDKEKVYRIIQYFDANQKDNNIVLVLGNLVSYFTKIFTLHYTHDKSKAGIARAIGINPFFAQEYITALNNYPLSKVYKIFTVLRTSDAKSKGAINVNISYGDLLKETIYQILNA